MVHVAGISLRTLSKVEYPSIPSAVRHASHSNNLPVPIFQGFEDSNNEVSSECLTEQDTDNDDVFAASNSQDFEPKASNQNDLNDLIHDLGLPKHSAELLASRLKERNLFLLLKLKFLFTATEKKKLKFFKQEYNFVFCHDIKELLNALGCDYVSRDWRLFVDSSKSSLKCVLLSNGNQYASIPIGYSVFLKESYQTMDFVSKKIKYSEHN